MGPLSMETKVIGGFVALLALIGLLFGIYHAGESAGKNKIELTNQKTITAAIVQDRQSAERRQQEEQAAAVARGKEQAAYETAIASAPGGKNSPAAHALACERLRQAFGVGSANLPASCRSSSGDSAQAGSANNHR